MKKLLIIAFICLFTAVIVPNNECINEICTDSVFQEF